MTSKLVVPETVQLAQVGTDPASVAGHAQVYAKDVGGIARLFMRAGDGGVSQIGSGTGMYSPPERWSQVNIAANQSAVPLSPQVSGNTNTIRMATSGSVVSLVTQLTEAITAGTLTVTVTKNGSPMTMSIVHTSGSGTQATQIVGIDTYAAGDFLGIQITTDAGFLPITTDIEAWIQCSEAVAGTPGSTIMVVGGTVTGSTNGSVFFADGGTLAQDNSSLFYDLANKRFGVGTSTPGTIVDIAGAGNTAAIALRAGGSAPVSAASTARLRFNQSTNKLQVSENGGAYVNIATGVAGVSIGDAVTGATVGSALFIGAGGVLQQDNANFFWDDTNNRLGIGTSTPTSPLHVRTDSISLLERTSTSTNSVFGVASVQHTTTADMVDGFGPSLLFRIQDDTSASLPIAYIGAARAGSDFDGALVFAPYQGGSPIERMRLTPAGQLQISALTTGSVPFVGASGAILQDNARFFWNDTNKVLQLTTNHATTGPLNITATAITAPSAIAFFDQASNFKGYWGWFNSGYSGFGHWVNRHGVFSYGGDPFCIGDTLQLAHVFGASNLNAFHEFNNGQVAAVSSASTGRLRYNTPTQKFQTSLNTAAYYDLPQLEAALTTGSIPFANASGRLAQDNANFFWDDTNNRLGLGTTAPIGILETVGATANHLVSKNTSAYSISSGAISFLSNDGVPSATDQRLGRIVGGGWSTTTFRLGASIDLYSEGAWTAGTSHPSYLLFQTTPTGSATSLHRMRIGQEGNVSIGLDPLIGGIYRLNVYSAGNSSTAAQVLKGQFYGLLIGTESVSSGNYALSVVTGMNAGGGATWAGGGTSRFLVRADGQVQISQLTTGSVLFAGASGAILQDNANFFWDDTNNRLGIGTTTPDSPLRITSANTHALRIQCTLNAGHASFSLYDDANVSQVASGWGNTGATDTARAGKSYWGTNAADFVVIRAFGTPSTVTTTFTADGGVQIHGSTSAVSAASTGRLRYDTTGQVLQISKNAAAYEAVASLATAQTFTRSQNVAAVALTDAANIATDASLGNVFTVTLADNRTLDNPTNLVSGGVYRWIVTQDATGSRTLAYGTAFKWPGGTAPTLTTAANAVDTIEAVYNGTVLLATFALNYS